MSDETLEAVKPPLPEQQQQIPGKTGGSTRAAGEDPALDDPARGETSRADDAPRADLLRSSE